MMPARFVLQFFDRKSAGDTRSQRGHRRLARFYRNFDVISVKMQTDRLIAGPMQFDGIAFFHLDRALVFRKFARLQGEIEAANVLRLCHAWNDGAGQQREEKKAAPSPVVYSGSGRSSITWHSVHTQVRSTCLLISSRRSVHAMNASCPHRGHRSARAPGGSVDGNQGIFAGIGGDLTPLRCL